MSSRIQAIPDLIVVWRRHLAEQLCEISRGVERPAIRIPIRTGLDDRIRTVRLRWNVRHAAEYADVTQAACERRAIGVRRRCYRIANPIHNRNGWSVT